MYRDDVTVGDRDDVATRFGSDRDNCIVTLRLLDGDTGGRRPSDGDIKTDGDIRLESEPSSIATTKQPSNQAQDTSRHLSPRTSLGSLSHFTTRYALIPSLACNALFV